jgi:hypothetical protein
MIFDKINQPPRSLAVPYEQPQHSDRDLKRHSLPRGYPSWTPASSSRPSSHSSRPPRIARPDGPSIPTPQEACALPFRFAVPARGWARGRARKHAAGAEGERWATPAAGSRARETRASSPFPSLRAPGCPTHTRHTTPRHTTHIMTHVSTQTQTQRSRTAKARTRPSPATRHPASPPARACKTQTGCPAGHAR